jgi:ABC-2 type transport system ATP-binding protein
LEADVDAGPSPLASTGPARPPGLTVGRAPALSVDQLVKRYGNVLALRGVSLEVRPGEIVGLLGPNGAGKSTMMKAVLGILRPDAGTIRLFGTDVAVDPVGAKRMIGYVPENPQLYEYLTGAEYLDFIADMYGVDPMERKSRIDRFLVALELAGHEHSAISSYSQGMKQKVALIAALLHRPRFLLLDEPLNALDPRAARIVKDLLRSLATTEGVAVLFSTHVLEIAEAICDEVTILVGGSVLATGTIPSLRQRAGLPGSGLEGIFLTLTGTGDLAGIVDALRR